MEEILAPKKFLEAQERIVHCLENLAIGSEFNRTPLEYWFHFVSDSGKIFEYRDMKNNRFYFTEKDEIALIYVGKQMHKVSPS